MAVAHVQMPLLFAVSTRRFETALFIFGAVVVLGALVSGIARRSFLSLTALFVLIGFVLGPGVTGVLDFSARSGFVGELAIVALVVILFRDGLEVEGEMLQAHWHLPLRKLVLAMPLTAVIVALATHLLTDLQLDRELPARRAALTDRPGAVLGRRHQPPRARASCATR